MLRKRSAEPSFKKKSELARKNRCSGSEDGLVHSIAHVQGSVSALELAERLAIANKGVLPSAADLYLETHSKVDPETKERIFISEKAEETMEVHSDLWKANFNRQREQCEIDGSQKSLDEIFFDVVGGYEKNEVYGLGSSAELYFQKPSSSRSSNSKAAYTPSEVIRLQQALENQKKETEELKQKHENLSSYVETLKPLLDQLLTRCNPTSPVIQPHDSPDDPSSGNAAAFAAQNRL